MMKAHLHPRRTHGLRLPCRPELSRCLKHWLLGLGAVWLAFGSGPTPTLGADFYLGSAIGGSTTGRQIPGLHLGVNHAALGVSVLMTGVRTPIYYYNGYMASTYYRWQAAKFWGGELWSGIGVSHFFNARGYRPTPDEAIVHERSSSHGPGIVVEWQFMPFAYIQLECLYGIRDRSALFMVLQELAWGSVGVRF